MRRALAALRAVRAGGRGHAVRLLALLALCALALQGVWLARVALMRWVDPGSTSFQRSEAWRLVRDTHSLPWAHAWADLAALGPRLPRAVLAAEDAGFVDHGGVEWEAVSRAWQRNRRAAEQAEQAAQRQARQPARPARAPRPPKVVGGSTLTQQLAKNLFLSGERTLPRKAQEFVITLMLEAWLPKERILEIYLNHVEWGEGVFGAQAAAHHYHGIDAARLTAPQAARLAVLLPAPKRYERAPRLPLLAARAAQVLAGMDDVELPR